jgi:hypothetical protein
MEWMDDPLRSAREELLSGRGETDPSAIELHAANADAAQVYLMTRCQIITVGMSGQIVDISIPAVKIAMDLLGVKDQVACLNQVRKLFHHFLEKSDD